ncbi:restriction endonuclease subunit S [Pseudoalteromonas sp. D48-MNA-CIBAN-0056]|uniref:restriction endonuclease subunit S n=1 Tax=Pseudoalteromonas sp. D48-MNA-CIBAN-0056 TaxID=3140417 RepID=UPI0033294673
MVPNGWTLTSLGKLCDINPKKLKKPENGKVSFIAMNQLSEEGQLISHLPREYEEVSKGFTSFKDGDVLVAKITPCFENGKGALVNDLINGIGFGSTEFHVLRAKENTSPEFIYYLTRTQELRVRGENNMQGSAGHRRVTADYFQAYKVLTPPLPEQRKIAKTLSTWDKAISTTERLIDNSKQQKKALMQQLLTGKKRLLDDSGKPFEGEWEEVKLGDLFSLLKSGLSRKLLDENVGVAVIRSNNMGSQFTTNKDLKFWYADDPQGANTQNYLLDDGDILINFINSLSQIGKTCIFREIGDVKSIYTTNILRAKPNTSLVQRDYLFYLTKTQRYLSHIKAITKPAVNQASFTTKDFGNFTFKIPSLLEQQKIAAVLTNTDKEIELLEQQLADLKQEKKALMQQLLTGKRRVTVDDKEVA